MIRRCELSTTCTQILHAVCVPLVCTGYSLGEYDLIRRSKTPNVIMFAREELPFRFREGETEVEIDGRDVEFRKPN